MNYDILETKERVIEDNDAVAEKLRRRLAASGIFLLI